MSSPRPAPASRSVPAARGGPPRARDAAGTLSALLRRAADTHPATVAVLDAERRCTFAELAARVDELARSLQQLAEPGDRVAVVTDNCLEWIELYYAVPAAGLVLTPLNPRTSVADQAAVLRASGATVLLGTADHLDALDTVPRPPSLRTVAAIGPGTPALPHPGATAGPPPEPDPAAVAWLIYTSGTTGTPKGVTLTHAGLRAAVDATVVERPVGPGDTFLTCFPLCHVAGYNVLVAHRTARPVVLLERWSPDGFVDAVEGHGVTMASVAPTMLSALLTHLEAHPADRSRLATLRAVAYGSAGIPGALLRRVLATLDLDFSQGYGMTEASGNVAFLGPDDHRRAAAGDDRLLASCGRPAAGVEVAVVDGDGRAVASGETGEIVLRGPSITPGYFGDPAATEDAWRGGWFHTGDLGRRDPDGYLFIVDRKKDLVVSGGENISSREVEEALGDLDGVAEVAVVGVPDEHWGEAVCACIVPAPGATIDPEEVRRAARQRVAAFKVPKHVVVVEELPRTSNGKVRKRDLRARAAAHLREPPQ
jgi:acyl-CoA synthetase (AMP-forming)/AMP-acid ligase II